MAKRRSTVKAGDSLPVDRTGQMIGQGDLVIVPIMVETTNVQVTVNTVSLELGYIKKLGKTYADVMVYDQDKPRKVRFHHPHRTLMVINGDILPVRNKKHEQMKLDAKMNTEF